MLYRKRPVVVEVIHFTPDTWKEVGEFLGGESVRNHTWSYSSVTGTIRIVTLEGNMMALPGDWIIKGVHGEFYPCKPDIFDKTYEKVGQ